eukprot:6432-Rhodomonas_salina.1
MVLPSYAYARRSVSSTDLAYAATGRRHCPALTQRTMPGPGLGFQVGAGRAGGEHGAGQLRGAHAGPQGDNGQSGARWARAH